MSGLIPRQLVEQFWQTMNTNDWHAVGALLHDDYLLTYPQSGERIRGRANFIAVNANYPATGAWRFAVQRLIADETEAATDVIVTEGSQTFRVISFFEFRDDRIWRMTEYWPDLFAPAASRAQWVELDP